MYLLSLLLTYLFFHSLIDFFAPNALTACAYLGLFVLATLYITLKQKRFPNQAIPAGVLCLLLALCFVLHNDGDLHWALLAMLVPLSGLYCIGLTGANKHPFGSFYVLFDLLHCEVFLPLRHLFAPIAAAFNRLHGREGKPDQPQKRKVWAPVVIGLIVAIPLLLIVVPLLIDSDAAFESIAGGVFSAVSDFLHAVGQWIVETFEFDLFALLLAFLCTPFIFSVIFSFANGTANAENRDTSLRYRNLQKMPVAFVATVLGVLSAVYLVYLLTQTGYFFAAFTGKLPFGTSITVTEYARRGFFELVKLAGVNFVLLALSVGLTRRKNARITTPVKALAIFLCLFTMLLCAISMAKIILYIRTFGLTEKRLYVFVADIVLFLSFLAIFLRFLFDRFPYMQIILCAAFTFTAVLGLSGVSNTIARYNTNGLLNGSLREISVADIYEVSGYAAYPYLQKIVDAGGELGKDAEKILNQMYDDELRWLYNEPFMNLEQNRVKQYVLERNKVENTFDIRFSIRTDLKIQSIGYSFFSADRLLSSGGVTNADNTPLKDEVVLTIDRADFPADMDWDQFGLQLEVELADVDGQSADKPYAVEIRNEHELEHVIFGAEYELTLTEDSPYYFVAY